MTWQYRVLHDPDDDDSEPFSMVEAILDHDGEAIGWSTPHPLKDDSIHGLIGQIMVMLNAAIEAECPGYLAEPKRRRAPEGYRLMKQAIHGEATGLAPYVGSDGT